MNVIRTKQIRLLNCAKFIELVCVFIYAGYLSNVLWSFGKYRECSDHPDKPENSTCLDSFKMFSGDRSRFYLQWGDFEILIAMFYLLGCINYILFSWFYKMCSKNDADLQK